MAESSRDFSIYHNMCVFNYNDRCAAVFAYSDAFYIDFWQLGGNKKTETTSLPFLTTKFTLIASRCLLKHPLFVLPGESNDVHNFFCYSLHAAMEHGSRLPQHVKSITNPFFGIPWATNLSPILCVCEDGVTVQGHMIIHAFVAVNSLTLVCSSL